MVSIKTDFLNMKNYIQENNFYYLEAKREMNWIINDVKEFIKEMINKNSFRLELLACKIKNAYVHLLDVMDNFLISEKALELIGKVVDDVDNIINKKRKEGN